MQMAQGDRQGVGGVLGGTRTQGEKPNDHPGNLRLRRPSAPRDRPLDPRGGELAHRNAGERGGDHHRPARLADPEGGGGVPPEERTLEGDHPWRVPSDEPRNRLVDAPQPKRQVPAPRPDRAVLDDRPPPARGAQDAVPEPERPRVDSQDGLRARVRIRW